MLHLISTPQTWLYIDMAYLASMEHPWTLARRILMLTMDGLHLHFETLWYNLFADKNDKRYHLVFIFIYIFELLLLWLWCDNAKLADRILDGIWVGDLEH